MAGDGRGWPGVVADVQTRPEIADAWVWMPGGSPSDFTGEI